MSDHDHEHVPPIHTHVPADGAEGAVEKSADQKDREAAWKAIEEFASSGKGKEQDLPMLVHRAAWPEGVRSKLPDLARHASGDTMLEVARVLDMWPAEALKAALGAKSKPSKSELTRYLRGLVAWRIGMLDSEEQLITELQTMLPGPLADVLPEIGTLPYYIQDKPRILRWYIATTNPTIAGINLAYRGARDDLVKALDTIDIGWSWLDHMHIAPSEKVGWGLVSMRDVTTNATAKPKLEALARQFTEDDNQRKNEEINARGEMVAQLGKKDDAALTDAAARTQGTEKGEKKQVAKRLAGESPELVLEFAITTNQSAQAGVELLDDAKGTKPEHVRELLRRVELDDAVKALKNDRSRKLVRKLIGRDQPLLSLFATRQLDEVHPIVVHDAALRQWMYEDDRPETLLWLAAGSAKGAGEGTRIVKREKTNKWVKQLSPGADEASLRRFVLVSKDDKATKYVRETLFRDPTGLVVDPSENEVIAVDPETYGGREKTRLMLATNEVAEDPDIAVQRLADLDERQRVEVLKDAAQMRTLLDDVSDATLVRAMFLLRPTVTQCLALPYPDKRKFPELVSYITTRPDIECYTAAKSEASIQLARKLLGKISPIDLYPVLRTNPQSLGKALTDNEALFEWILEDTEPSRAMSLFARDAAVRQIAANMMGERQDLTENLPAYKNMLSEGKRGYDILHERMNETSKEESSDYKEGNVRVDSDVNDKAKKLKQAAKKATLWEEIDELDRSGAADAAAVISLVQRAPAKDQVALLDGTHAEAANKVRRLTRISPAIVFPDLSIAQLLSLPTAIEWLFIYEVPTAILARLAGSPTGIKAAAKHFDTDHSALDAFPRGGELMPRERLVIDEMKKHVKQVTTLHALFKVRFDVTVENFDLAETAKLWDLVARLPPSQLNQNAVAKIIEKDIGALGQWADPNVEIDDSPERFVRPDKQFDEAQQMTLDEVKQLYGLSDQDVEVASDPDSGWLVEDQGTYTVKEIEFEQFNSTVLHEIGHSIDTMLGERTEVVYGEGGWKRYGLDQFEEWASDMDGFDGIKDSDRPRVIEAWKSAFHSGTPVNKLVDDEHPALKSKATAPLVDAATRGSLFNYTEDNKSVYGQRVCVRNGLRLFSMPKQTYLSAPSEYALSAPEEFFAECYVEYYRLYDGKPGSDRNKGGRLPVWIKEWFAQHVDRIKLNPNRVKPKP